MRIKYFFALMLAVPSAVIGLEPLPAPKTNDIMIFAGSPHYSNELAAKGVQGRAVLSTEIRLDGTLAPAVLVESSGSAELDAAALNVVASHKTKPRADVKPIRLSILFYKDSANSVVVKTCSEFNTDYTYFAATFPTKPPSEMTIFGFVPALALGLVGVDLSVLSNLKTAPEKIVVACSERPESKFFKEYLSILKP